VPILYLLAAHWCGCSWLRCWNCWRRSNCTCPPAGWERALTYGGCRRRRSRSLFMASAFPRRWGAGFGCCAGWARRFGRTGMVTLGLVLEFRGDAGYGRSCAGPTRAMRLWSFPRGGFRFVDRISGDQRLRNCHISPSRGGAALSLPMVCGRGVVLVCLDLFHCDGTSAVHSGARVLQASVIGGINTI